jgi:adenosylcobinamide-GDP ribazoletransferase
MEFYQAALRRSVVFFPLVGGLVGWSTGVAFVLFCQIFSPWLAACLALAIEAALTGAFHDDAFADTWDAFGGGWTREQVLLILKDSRLGTYGTLALVLGTATRISCMVALDGFGTIHALVAIGAAGSLARFAIVAMMVTVSPVENRDGQAKDVAGNQTLQTLAWSALLSIPVWIPWFFLAPGIGAISILVAATAWLWFRRKILERLGGTTGDLLGATAYLTQLAVLIVATARIA